MSRAVTDILLSWGPMVLLIGAWLFAMSKSRTQYQNNVKEMLRVAEEQLKEMRTTNERLARVESLLARPAQADPVSTMKGSP